MVMRRRTKIQTFLKGDIKNAKGWCESKALFKVSSRSYHTSAIYK